MPTKPTGADRPAPRVLDLDAARAERAAKLGEPPVILDHGRRMKLPAELPLAFVEFLMAEQITDALATIFEPDDLAAWLTTNPSVEDLMALSEGVAALYGLEGGFPNLSASGASSSTTSDR